MTVIVYSKPACVQCAATTRALDAKGIGYELVDLTTDEDAMNRVVALGLSIGIQTGPLIGVQK